MSDSTKPHSKLRTDNHSGFIAEFHNEFEIVPYNKKKHSKTAAEAFASGFSHDHWPIWNHSSFRLTQDLLNVMASLCNLNYVIEEKSTRKAYGQIFCMSPASSWKVVQSIPLILKTLLTLLSGLYFLKKIAWQHVFALRSFLPFLKKHPSHSPHYEVLLFVMHEKMQGKGWGKKLMDTAILEMHKQNAAEVILLTDSTMSWKFYEKYNFQRIIDISVGNTYKIAMNSSQEFGYVYKLDIPEKISSIKRNSLDLG